jgi:serine/threonine-protein kinase
MFSVELDPEGRLTRFLAVPPQVIDDTASAPANADWTAVVAAAGLDPARFHSSSPRWIPPVESDANAAWEGTFPEDPNSTIRAEAAAYRGKPVYFELVGPWSVPERMQESPVPLGEKIGFGAVIGIVLVVLVLGGVIARRNLRLGRGDRAGALRVSWLLFGVTFAQWIVGHHAADPGEFFAMLNWIARGCFWALYIGVMYLALEPYVRRRWPDVLISWSRLLSGRFRDPLVGRDLLVGAAAGALVSSGYFFVDALPAWFNVPGKVPMFYNEDAMSLRGMGGLIGQLLEQPLFAIWVGEGILFMVFLVAVVVRRRGAAIAIGGLVVLLTGFPRENVAVELPFVILDMVVLMVLLSRFGLLAVVIEMFVTQLLMRFPLTLDPSRWYFGHGMLAVAIVLGLAIYGFHTSLGGQKALGGLALEES